MRRNTRTLLPLFLALALMPGISRTPAAPPAPDAGNEVVATVNGRSISERDFNLAVQLQFRRRGPGQRRLNDLRSVRETVLESLIDNEILYQKAVEASIKAKEEEVTDELGRVREGFGTTERFAAFLEASGVSERVLEEQIRRSLMVARFAEEVVTRDLAVSDADVRRYYDANPGEMTRPAGVRISQIVVRVAQGASMSARTRAREKIEAIYDELQAGKEFAEMARKYSDGPEAERGGDSGFVTRGGAALPIVESMALRLKPGQMSDIVETRRGFHIIKATESRPATPIPFAEAEEAIRRRLTSADGSTSSAFIIATSVAPPARQRASSSAARRAAASASVAGS